MLNALDQPLHKLDDLSDAQLFSFTAIENSSSRKVKSKVHPKTHGLGWCPVYVSSMSIWCLDYKNQTGQLPHLQN